MKIAVLITLSVFTFFGAQAQSKKKMNQQLLAELTGVEKNYDSIKLAHRDKRSELLLSKNDVISLREQITDKKVEEARSRYEIQQTYTMLSDLRFDANSIVSLKDVETLYSPGLSKIYTDKPEWFTKKIILLEIIPVQDMTDLKLKAQNEILKAKIEEYKKINDQNRILLVEEQGIIGNLTNLKIELSNLYRTYVDFNKVLEDKAQALDVKYTELNRIREEEKRLKEEKELADANKALRKKYSKSKFIPPVIVDREVDDYPVIIDTDGDMNVSSDRYDRDPVMPEIGYEPAPTAPAILEVVEETAMFPGGRDSMMVYIANNLKYPEIAKELQIKAKAYLKFVVNTSGEISNIKVLRGISDCKECDNAAIQVIKGMPKWTPAKNDGRSVNSYYTLPFPFNAQ